METEMQEKQRVDELLKKLKTVGAISGQVFSIIKSPTKKTHINDQGKYQVTASHHNPGALNKPLDHVIMGANYEATIEEVEAWVDEKVNQYKRMWNKNETPTKRPISGNNDFNKLQSSLDEFFELFNMPEIRRVFRNCAYELSSYDCDILHGQDDGLQSHILLLNKVEVLLEDLERWHQSQAE